MEHSIEITIKTQNGTLYYHDIYFGTGSSVLSLLESNIQIAYAYQRGFLSVIVESEDFRKAVLLYKLFNNDFDFLG